MMRVCLAALAIVPMLTGCSKIVVKKLDASAGAPSISARDGVIYALPRTVVRVAVKVDETEVKPAPFGRYAPIFAPGLTAVCAGSACDVRSTRYSLEDGAALSTYGEPDMQRVYLVQFAGGGATDQNIALTWNEAGLLSSANATVTNRTGDVIVASVNAAAGVAGKIIGGGAGGGGAAPTVPNDISCIGITGLPKGDEDQQYLDAIRASNLDPGLQTAMLRNYCLMSKLEREKIKFDTVMFKGALLAYKDEIEPLAGALGGLLSGTSNALTPGELIDKITLEMNTRLTRLYLGTKSTSAWSGLLDVRDIGEIINDADGQEFPLLWIDSTNGFCVPNFRLAPESPALPKFGQATADPTCAEGQHVKPVMLHLAYGPAKTEQLAGRMQDGDSSTDESSFRYRIPMQVSASVKYDGRSQAGARFFVAQLGKVASLPAKRHSKTLTYNLSLIEATGGLKSFTLGTTGSIDAATVTSLGTSAAGIQDARNTTRTAAKAAADAAATAADPITGLTKQDNLLKVLDDICTIQKKYNLPCTVPPTQ